MDEYDENRFSGREDEAPVPEGIPEPTADEGDAISWMADPDAHLEETPSVDAPAYKTVVGPLPVCDYTGEPDDEPCEEPAVVKRWSGAAVITAAAIGSVVGGMLVAAALLWAFGALPGSRPFVSSPAGTTKAANITITPDSNLDFAEAVAEKVTPSVVNVTIQRRAVDPFTGNTQMRDVGNGSGVIIDSKGFVLTNNHVVEAADRIIVTVGLDDVEAKVVGVDPSTDMAVLSIPEGDYPAIEVGSSASLRVGQFVVAVGSPFGLEKTVTAGIISALQRSSLSESATDITAYTNLIQTDAAINPGNSGGALVDEQGKLIGINTLIQSPSGAVGAPQSAGIGFAIPVDFAMSVAEQLIETGSAVHPYMGVSSTTIDENLAAQFQLPVTRGALIRFVEPGSPADDGGLQRGDIMTEIRGREIKGVEDVFAAIRAAKIGETVSVVVIRADARRELSVTLGSDAQRQ
ncbi:MAG: trypsin-like peptidase domain-containing protein [Actinomycetota bacterium]|nr:trypsin-like peptidase domain-containing protein [Actinomycetota bacterium]